MSGLYPSRGMSSRLTMKTSFRTSPPYTPFIGPPIRRTSYGFPSSNNAMNCTPSPAPAPISQLRRETSFVSEQEISPLALDGIDEDVGPSKVDSMRIAVEQICLTQREIEDLPSKGSLATRRGLKRPFHLTLTSDGFILSQDTKSSLGSNPFTPVEQMIPSRSNPPPAPRQPLHPSQGRPLPNSTISRVLSFNSPTHNEDDGLTPITGDMVLQPRRLVVPLLSPIKLVADGVYKYSPQAMEEDDDLYGSVVVSSPTPTRTPISSR